MAPPFLTATWRHLLFVNYEAERSLVQRYVPPGTELDLLDGRALVSIVAFRFLDTRLLGIPIPFHRDFDEVNLRAYVRRREGGVWRRGVVFVRELVPRRAIAWTARVAYNEPYSAARMRSAIAIDAVRGGTVRYDWQLGGAWHSVGASVAGAPAPIDPDDGVGFITEHYHGYTPQRDGSTVEYAVQHPRWRAWTAEQAHFDCDVRSVYGGEWEPVLKGTPYSSFLCDGAPVTISFPRRLPR